MEIRDDCYCCGLNELDGVDVPGGPEEALKGFIWSLQDLYTGPEGDDYDYSYNYYYERQSKKKDWDRPFLPSAFYVFTTVIKNSKGGKPRTYGEELASYIRKHKLGDVVETPARLNRVNHPDHLLRAYLWSPSVKGLKAWWKRIHTEKESKTKAKD